MIEPDVLVGYRLRLATLAAPQLGWDVRCRARRKGERVEADLAVEALTDYLAVAEQARTKGIEADKSNPAVTPVGGHPDALA